MHGAWYKTSQLQLAYMTKKPAQPQQNQQKPPQAKPNAGARPPPAAAQKPPIQQQQQQQGNKNQNQNQKGQQSKPANQPNQQQQQKGQKNPKQQNQGNQNQQPVPQPLFTAQPPQTQMVAMAPVQQQGGQVVYVPVTQMPQAVAQPPSYLMSAANPTMMQPMQFAQMNPMMQAAPPPYSPNPNQQGYSGKGNQNRQHNNPGGNQKGKQKQGGQTLKNKLFITYLPDSVTDMSLHQMFSRFGAVKGARLQTGKGDKPPAGVILFEKDHEAAAALNALNGTMVKFSFKRHSMNKRNNCQGGSGQ
ncbi:hypothetical protein WR25_04554 isoform D [Diploscapter pachys]|nr:hypothetical protein WR25_04554 isoform B [Diploscapter pachys]PAV55769.1 hypothetical protein WR25_04554 isoform C [Diploscapter pachys]PAV55770.1 hypothetical protein WR25_04554 isoform D [Diploscapter pachys]